MIEKVPDNTTARRSRWHALLRWSPWLLVLWPVLALFQLISACAINAPFLDDYMSVPLFDKAAHHALTVHDFFAAQMEHRIAWVRVMQLLFHKLWPGHCWIAQIWYNWVLLCLTLVNVALLLRQTTGRPLRSLWPLMLPASLALFSPVQFNIILWPFMHQVVTLAFFLTGALVVWHTRWNVWLRFALALLCALLATLSFTAGILIWLVLVPVMIWSAPMPSPRTRLVVIISWLVALGITMALYFHKLKNEVSATYAMGQGETATLGRDLSEAAADPLKAAFYMARILGNPLMRGSNTDLMETSLWTGFALLALYALSLGWWFRRYRDESIRRNLLPWLALGTYGIGAAAAITLGRVWIGTTGAYALSTRYVIHAVPLLVALPVMLWIIVEDFIKTRPRTAVIAPRVLAGAAVALVVLELGAWAYGARMMDAWSSSRKRGIASTMFFKAGIPVESCYPDGLTADCRLADDLHLLKPAMIKDRSLENFSIASSPLSDTYAVWSSLRIETSDGAPHAIVAGRAILKKHWRPADTIVLAYEAGEHHWEIFHVTNVVALPLYLSSMIMRDLEFMHQPADGVFQSLSTFTADFKLTEVPAGKHRIAAWAYDFDTHRLSLIPGAYELDSTAATIKSLGNDPQAVDLEGYSHAAKKPHHS